MRRGGRYKAGVGKVLGTPTVNPPEPQAIDDYSGFKVPLSQLKKDWQGLYTVSPDVRNPQDFVRGVKDVQNLPFARPEAPNVFVAGPILWQDGTTFIVAQNGVDDIYEQGLVPAETL